MNLPVFEQPYVDRTFHRLVRRSLHPDHYVHFEHSEHSVHYEHSVAGDSEHSDFEQSFFMCHFFLQKKHFDFFFMTG